MLTLNRLLSSSVARLRPRICGTALRPLSTAASASSKNRQTAYYAAAGIVAVLGASYAAVPVYRAFCQASGGKMS